MVEWYEAYADYTDGMRRTEEFTAASVLRGARHDRDHARGPRDRHGAALAAQAAGRGDPGSLRRRRHGAARSRGAARSAGRARRGRGRGRRHLAAARRPRALPLRRAEHRRAGLPGRLPDRALAAGAPVRGRSVPGRALRGVLLRHGVRERLQRAQRPRAPAPALPGAARAARRRRTRTPSRSTTTTSRPCATACPRPPASASASTASRCSSATARRSATWCSSRRCATRLAPSPVHVVRRRVGGPKVAAFRHNFGTLWWRGGWYCTNVCSPRWRGRSIRRASVVARRAGASCARSASSRRAWRSEPRRSCAKPTTRVIGSRRAALRARSGWRRSRAATTALPRGSRSTSSALRSLPALDHALSTGALTLDQVAAAAEFATPASDAELARVAVGKAPSADRAGGAHARPAGGRGRPDALPAPRAEHDLDARAARARVQRAPAARAGQRLRAGHLEHRQAPARARQAGRHGARLAAVGRGRARHARSPERRRRRVA